MTAPIVPRTFQPAAKPWPTKHRCKACGEPGARRIVEGLRSYELADRAARTAWLCVGCFTRIIGDLL